MAYDVQNYDIKSKLMEWWRHDGFLEPINRYSQELIKELIGSLLSNFSVVQPFQIWKSVPSEYSWVHVYQSHDPRLRYPQGGTSPLILKKNQPINAFLPNSKKNCHGVIQLQLQGNQKGLEQSLKKLTITNANQTITFNDITTTSDIKIFTEDGTILIDGVERSDLVKGRFDKIYPQAQNTNYNEVDIDDENKITYLSIESTETVNFALKIKMIHPIYYVEQNMRIHTVSAFPIEWIKLYGFYCHDFNNKQEWRFLWEKNYKENERVVYDRITKQFDCETFYMQVKLYGIGVPFVCGFPQEEFSSNPAFNINKNLDKWGRIYGLPRRYYKTRISEEEEPYTYPPYYNYSIEQDYWYEERLVNEYRYNDDAINSTLIKDSDLNNIAILQCIDPRVQDIYVYTETIKNKMDYHKQTNDIYPTQLSEEGEGQSWQNPHEIANTNTTATEVNLMPQNSDSFNEKKNQTKVLSIQFNDIPELPKNINITGLELQLNGLTDVHSSSLTLDSRSQMLLPTVYTKANGEVFTSIDNVQISSDMQYWEKGKGRYTIGGQNNLFGLNEIKRNQIQNGLTFNIGFTNLNTFLKATIVLYSIKLIIYYEQIYDNYTVKVKMSGDEIVLNDKDKQSIRMKINFKNTGKIPAIDKNVYIATATGIDITKNRFPSFDLDVSEEFTIGENSNGINDEIIITPTKYQCLELQNNSTISQTIDIRKKEFFDFYYKTNNSAQIDIYVNNEKIDSIITNTSNWTKYSYTIKKCDRLQNEEECSQMSHTWGDNIVLTLKILDCSNNVYIKNPTLWTTDDSVEIVEKVETGLYDIIVFCDDESIKHTITVREGLE